MNDIAKEEHVDLGSLTQLRDEIRLRLHLAQLDAKDRWHELEGRLATLEHRITSEAERSWAQQRNSLASSNSR